MGMNWIDLAQYRDKWRPFVNAVMNLQVPTACGEFLDQLITGQLLKKHHNPLE